jgi:hypothetical protein
VNHATGKSLVEFAYANIFALLGLMHTRFCSDHTLVLPERISVYARAATANFQWIGRRIITWWVAMN